MDAMRREIEQVDAANVPLPLQEGDGLLENNNSAKDKGKGKERADPLGPL